MKIEMLDTGYLGFVSDVYLSEFRYDVIGPKKGSRRANFDKYELVVR